MFISLLLSPPSLLCSPPQVASSRIFSLHVEQDHTLFILVSEWEDFTPFDFFPLFFFMIFTTELKIKWLVNPVASLSARFFLRPPLFPCG